MLLATISALRLRVKEKNDAKVNHALGVIISDVTQALSAHLNMSFERREVKDAFDIQEIPGKIGRVIRLKLSNSFIDISSGPGLSIMTHNSLNDYATGLGSSGQITHSLDPISGLVTAISGWEINDVLSVTYEAGFTVLPDTDVAEFTVYQNVPKSLSDPTLLFAEYVYNAKYGSGDTDADYMQPPKAVVNALYRSLGNDVSAFQRFNHD